LNLIVIVTISIKKKFVDAYMHSLRSTEQRRIILEELKNAKTHPTANEVYDMVRKRLPRISLGTVYRNLEILSEAGLIQKLELAGTQKRFDGTVENHYHVRCLVCGRVEDLPMDPIPSLDNALSGYSGYKILWHRLEFMGLCPKCQSEVREALLSITANASRKADTM
jgi:Fur family ferric uptake transcriptional regulator